MSENNGKFNYLNHRFEKKNRAELENNIHEVVLTRISKEFNIDPKSVDSNTSLTHYGLDSVNAISISVELADEFGIDEIPTSVMYEHPSLSAIVSFVADTILENSEEKKAVNQNPNKILDLLQTDSINYEGGENFNLLDVLTQLQSFPFVERVKYSSELFETVLDGPHSLYKREILSAIDRTVFVKDAVTGNPKQMLLFASNNYLGLANHKLVKEKTIKWIDKYGTGVGSAPLLSGYTVLHKNLEEKLSQLKGTEDTLIYPTGYSANVGLVSALALKSSVILFDEYSHASFRDGIKLSESKSFLFKHNDVSDLEKLLILHQNIKTDLFVSVEGIYSMDGDIAPLDLIIPLCKKYNAKLIIDDAHATCVLGKNGSGTGDHFGMKEGIDITMGTLSKALAVMGGFVCGKKEVINYLRLISRSYMFSTSMPMQVAASALAGLEVVDKEPELLDNLRENILYVKKGFQSRNVPVNCTEFSPIILLIVPEKFPIRKVALELHEMGIFINSIEYPAVPINQQRFRISLMSSHTKDDLDLMMDKISYVWGKYTSKEISLQA